MRLPSLHHLLKNAQKPVVLRIAYKLAAEAFFLVLLLASGFFLAEVILPGFVTSRINFSAVYTALIIFGAPVLWLSGFLQKEKAAEAAHSSAPSRKAVLLFALLFTLLLANDTQDLGVLQRSVTVLAVFLGSAALLSLFLVPSRSRSE